MAAGDNIVLGHFLAVLPGIPGVMEWGESWNSGKFWKAEKVHASGNSFSLAASHGRVAGWNCAKYV